MGSKALVTVIILLVVIIGAGFIASRLNIPSGEQPQEEKYLVITKAIHIYKDYVLDRDVLFKGSGAAFIIHSNVVFDGNGHKIIGENLTYESQNGISVENIYNVVVKNVDIVGIYMHAIIIQNAANVTIINNYIHDPVDPETFKKVLEGKYEVGWGITVRDSGDSLDPKDAVVIANNTITRFSEGIHAAYNGRALLVANNTVFDCVGQQMKFCMTNDGCRVINNTMIGGVIGLFVTNDQDNLLIEGNTFVNNEGIYLRNPTSTGNRIIGNRFYNSNPSIKIEDSDENTIEYNEFYSCSTRAIRLKSTTRNKVHHNVIKNSSTGIALEIYESVPPTNNEIYNNEIAGCGIGILLEGAESNEIHTNLIANSTQYGISIQDGSRNNSVHGNVVYGSGVSDLFEDDSSKGRNNVQENLGG